MNKENYKAALSGAHSQGKTTLLNALQLSPVMNELHFSFLTNVARGVSKYLPINEGGNLLTQYMVISKHVEACHQPGRWLTDRSVLDPISYTEYHLTRKQLSCSHFNTLYDVYWQCLEKYDRIFYIVPELPLKDDGQRSVQESYFNEIVRYFDNNVHDIQRTHPNKIVFVKGSVAERVAIVEKQIQQDLS